MTDLAASLREISRAELDVETRRRVATIERAGARVSLYEVVATRGVLIIAHDGARPSEERLRTALAEHLASQAAPV